MPISAANGPNALVVLVVEDDALLRYDVAECLRDAGHAVVEVASGEAAIAICKSGMAIDAVFTDIDLNGPMSGWDVAEHFRMDRPNAPVFYASGKSFDDTRCVSGSVFFAKPYSCPHILESLRAAANRMTIRHF